MLFDSHAHINEASYSPEERAELIKTIEASDVDYVADIGYMISRLSTKACSLVRS